MNSQDAHADRPTAVVGHGCLRHVSKENTCKLN